MTPPVARPAMLIRRPAAEVFEAFVDPEITSRFWFSSGSGTLAPGAEVTWTWGMYGCAFPARVTAFDPPRRLAIEWDEGPAKTDVEWIFEPRGPDATFLTIVHSGFLGDENEQVRAALDGMNGFSLVLAGVKVFLEHGIEPNFVLDRHPDMIVEGWRRG